MNRYISIFFFFALVIVLAASCKTSTGSIAASEPERTKPKSIPNGRSVAVGEPQKNSAVAVILASGIGGEGGNYISRQMDKQAEDIGKADMRGAKILRIGEGIKITLDGSELFGANATDLSPISKKYLEHMASILATHNNSKLIIEGHTDGSGSSKANVALSERRAQVVADYLAGHNVDRKKIATRGLGETQPLFSNSTEEGRKQNRRVEVIVIADDNLRAEATKL